MPTKIRSRPAARSFRGSSHRRKDKKVQGCKRVDSPKPSAPKIIANSLFALTLKAKSWGDIAGTFPGHRHHDTAAVYKELLACYNNAVTQLGGSAFVPTDVGDMPSKKLGELIEAFRQNILPEGFEFNIDTHYNSKTEKEAFHFTVYKECEYREWWHYFELKPVLVDIKKRNPRLHDFFLVFLSSFLHYTGIPAWWNGALGYSEWQLPEHLAELEYALKEKQFVENDEEQLKDRILEIKNTIEDYRHGLPRQYYKKITSISSRTPDSLLRSLKAFSSKSYLVKFMKQACELMKTPATIRSFCYEQVHGESAEGLSFYSQVSIIWDLDDAFTKEEMECLDSEAQGCGVFPPILHGQLMPKGKMQDVQKFTSLKTWPMQLSKLWTIFDALTISIKSKMLKRK